MKMKKIALIEPRGTKYGSNVYLKDFLDKNNVVSDFYGAWETPNLSLLTISSLIPDSFEVSFIDEDHGQKIDFDAKYDIVAVTGMTQQITRAYAIADEFRKRGACVVIGGIHATIMPDEAQQHADTVFRGEGELIWPLFLEEYLKGTHKQRYENKSVIDLSCSPVPDYAILDKSLYKSYSIQTTRGCPRSCNYCTLPIMYGRTYRHKSVAQVVREIEAVQRIGKDTFIFFVDDNMFINREYSKKLLAKIKAMDITWGTQTDISVADDEELLKMLYASGCHWLFIGFENTTKQGLSYLDEQKWKADKLEVYESSIERIHRNGINIWGSFMFGGDNDTKSVFEETLDFTLRNELYSGSFTILTPLPGTRLYRQMEQQGRIIDHDWSRYTFWDVVFRPKHMTPDELAKGVLWVYDQFYSPQNVTKRASGIRKRLRSLASKDEKHGIRA